MLLNHRHYLGNSSCNIRLIGLTLLYRLETWIHLLPASSTRLKLINNSVLIIKLVSETVNWN